MREHGNADDREATYVWLATPLAAANQVRLEVEPSMFEEYPDLMTPDEAREALGIGRTMMYRLLNDGSIKHLRIGRRVKIPKRYLLDFVENECCSGAATASNPACR